MNGKQRVQAAIARQPVDMIPLGFYAVDHDTVARILGRPTFVRNKIATQLALWDGRRAELADGLKRDTVEFFRKIDCADLLLPKEAMLLPPAGYTPDPPRKIGPDVWEDAQGRVYKASWEANELACVHDPTRRSDFSVAEFETPMADPPPPDESIFEVFDYVYDQLGETRYIASPSSGVSGMTLLGGMEHGLLLYAMQPDVIEAANRRSCVRQNAADRSFVRKNAPGVLMEQDAAGTNGPMISPKSYRSYCLPFVRARVQHVKQYAPQVIWHSCGNNIPLMEMYIEAGIDCYQSLQTTAGMEIGFLKERYGADLCFWGGVPVEHLIAGTPAEVRGDVRAALERGRGTGFILGPSHSIAMNTKYDNFMAMLDEFVKLRDKYA